MSEIPEDITQFIETCSRLCHRQPVINVVLRPHSVITIISCMQLALRHPDIPASVAGCGREIVDQLIDYLESIEPYLGPALRKGFRPEEDLDVTPPGGMA